MLGFRNPPASVRPPSLCTYRSLRLSPSPMRHHAVWERQGPTQHRLTILEPRAWAARAAASWGFSVWWDEGGAGPQDERLPEAAPSAPPPPPPPSDSGGSRARRGGETRERRTPGGAAEVQARLCAATTAPPLGPSCSRHSGPDSPRTPNRTSGVKMSAPRRGPEVPPLSVVPQRK